MSQELTGVTIVAELRGTVSTEYPQHDPDVKFQSARNISPQNGSGSNEVNREFAVSGKLAKSGFVNINFYDGSQLDVYGNTITLDSLKAIQVNNVSDESGSSSSISVLSNGIPCFTTNTEGVIIGPGGSFQISAPDEGYSIGPSVSNNITILNQSRAFSTAGVSA